MTKVHLIKDESLGGIEREYVEVDRKADVGDFVVVVNAEDSYDQYNNGDIIEAEEISEYGIYNSSVSEVGNRCGLICDSEYKTLEPRNIVQIDGKRYGLVDRKAEVGEKVLIVGDEDLSGRYGEVMFYFGKDASIDIGDDIDYYPYLQKEEYRVLEPVKTNTAQKITVDITANDEFIDLIANLARRVSSLESQMSDTQGNVERQAQELENHLHSPVNWATQDEFIELNAKVEMLTDDIVMLDERTMPERLKEVDAVDFSGFIEMVADKVADKLIGGAR